MKKEELFNILGEVDEKKVAAAGMAVTAKKKSFPVWLKWGAMVACLCLVVAGIGFFNYKSSAAPPSIVSYYDTDYFGGVYVPPEPGTYFCFGNVEKARKCYAGQEVKFLLAFDIFNDEGEIISDEEKNAEYQRLSDLGYKLYQTEYWNYTDYKRKLGKEIHPVTLGLFTEEELANFNANPKYGYAFSFVINSDGTRISVEESDRVTEFVRDRTE